MQGEKYQAWHRSLSLKMEEGDWAKERRQPLETEQGKEKNFTLEPPERNTALPTPWF